MRKSKRALLALTAVGALAVAGAGAGTFATFNATITNSGNSFTTGDITLSQTTPSATTCYSSGGAGNTTNVNSGCTALISSSNLLAPSTAPTVLPLTLSNIGNLAGNLYFSSSGCTSATGPDSNPKAFTGSSSLCGSTYAALFEDTSGSSLGTEPPSVATCVWGCNSSTTWGAASGSTGTATISSSTPSTLTITTGLAGVSKNDTLQLLDGSNTVTATATTVASGSITLSPQPSSAFQSGSISVVDQTAAAGQITKFLSGVPSSNTSIKSTSLAGNGGKAYYYLVLYLPSTATDNAYMNKQATFSLTWYLEQAAT